MTVVAWDGRTLAADRRLDWAGTLYAGSKLLRFPDGRLVGHAGNRTLALELVGWIRRGARRGRRPRPDDDVQATCSVLVVQLDGSALIWTESWDAPVHELAAGEPCALGSGREFALGAIEAGADAVRAVEIAIARCEGCGDGIDTLTLRVGRRARS